MAGRQPVYCFDCKANVRGTYVEHLGTRRHRESTNPRPKRRSRLSYAAREGGMPSVYIAARQKEPTYLWEEEEE